MSPFPYLKITSKLNPWQSSVRDNVSTTCLLSYLSVLSHLSYWNTQSYNRIIIFFAIFLRVIPIDVPISIRRPTSPNRLTIFPTSLTSVLKVTRYPACILKFSFLNRKPNTLKGSLYPTFLVYFMDYIRPNIFISLLQAANFLSFNRWIISPTLLVILNGYLIFQRTISDVSDLFYKVTTFILFCQVLCELFFLRLVSESFPISNVLQR